MEYVIGLVAVAVLGFLWHTNRKNKLEESSSSSEAAPYKVETPPTVTEIAAGAAVVSEPAPVKCGCGRSPTGFCTGLHKLTPAEWATHPDNPVKPVAEEKPAAKAKKPAAPKKPAVMKAKEKAPAKKPAKKPTAKKSA